MVKSAGRQEDGGKLWWRPEGLTHSQSATVPVAHTGAGNKIMAQDVRSGPSQDSSDNPGGCCSCFPQEPSDCCQQQSRLFSYCSANRASHMQRSPTQMAERIDHQVSSDLSGRCHQSRFQPSRSPLSSALWTALLFLHPQALFSNTGLQWPPLFQASPVLPKGQTAPHSALRKQRQDAPLCWLESFPN